jgi:rare lipoprotein A (peptidoglycan hydrolase)
MRKLRAAFGAALLACTLSSSCAPQVFDFTSSGIPLDVVTVWAPLKERTTAVVNAFTGPASWYGRYFHGRLTANGERFNMNARTAAHRSLPFGTLVRVTNTLNGMQTIVRINDRGPYVGDRIIDLSRAAARAVKMEETGVAAVKLEVLDRLVLGTGYRKPV